MHLVTFEHRTEGVPGPDGQPDGANRHAWASFEYGRPGSRRLGALLPPGPHAGDVIDLNLALAQKLAREDVGAPEAEADSRLPADMLDFLAGGERAHRAATIALDWARDALDRYDAPDLRATGVALARRGVRLCAPVPRPGKIVAAARNYAAHAAERGAPAAVEPVLFLKAPSAVIGPEDAIALPRACRQVDYEGELAAVIGCTARNVEPQSALQFVGGYCVANDVSARDFQNARGQHFIGKSCDGFAPLGPALVTADEVPDPQALTLQTTLSGQLVQKASTAEMLFSVAELIAFTSRLMTLEPGDVLLTGTPAGVGAAATPPRWLRDGDVVDIEIERIGRLRSYVRSE